MDIKKIYKTHIINKLKNNKNKWQSKHVTSNKYTHALHLAI